MGLNFNIDNARDISKQFHTIANNLILNHELVVNDARFNFTEIEFYYNSDNHKDEFTHDHSMKAGRWRFHNSGFDITLKGENGHGGILIRGVERVNKIKDDEKDNFINGPRKVIFEIFKELNPVGDGDNFFGIVKKEIQDEDAPDLYWTYRQGLEKEADFQKADYRCIAKRLGGKYPKVKNMEAIAKGFDDAEKAHKFLGYEMSYYKNKK